MAAKCIDEAARKKASDNCRITGGLRWQDCERARLRLCPPPDVQPAIEQGKDGITLLGVYQVCKPQPVELAPYPPSRPLPNEARAQADLERLRGQISRQSGEMLKLEMRATRARKLELGAGFWLGLGLVGLGGAALYLRR